MTSQFIAHGVEKYQSIAHLTPLQDNKTLKKSQASLNH